ncbi:gamma-interferon-inducible lysosomal thiol reductase-like [Haliotis rubra]|uniref:gamma-interferon-inducible lysosomal thiol reductase-like n=1 Tax=Haliotis rubra TaxID=36100 RepID=UPI001EE608E0|nr:gamma-interferon-inducible lysosomal thiol reductase-like [Haliotis rubra]
MLHSVLGLVVTVVAVCSADVCRLPSHLWCSSRKTAEDCQVTQQCSAHDWRHQAAAPPVNLVLYYETLCPYCKQFITDQLYPTHVKLDSDILNITVLPFGNAEEKQEGNKWIFTCQHGRSECEGNLIATCALKTTSFNSTAYLPFLNCMEAAAHEHVIWFAVLKNCAVRNHVSEADIRSCMKSDAGNELEHEMGVATKKEGVEYVPWIVINGQHTNATQQEAQDDLLKLICKTYTGPKPQACTSTLTTDLSVSYKHPQ